MYKYELDGQTKLAATMKGELGHKIDSSFHKIESYKKRFCGFIDGGHAFAFSTSEQDF